MSGLAQMYDLKDEKQAKEYLDKLGIEYRFQCFHEKLPDGCHRLADHLEAFMKDIVKARQVFETNCLENNHGQSCFKYGNHCLVGKGGEKDFKKAHSAFLKSCDLGYGPGCHNVALLNQRGEVDGGRKDFVAAKEFLHLGCDRGNIPSCNLLSTYYINGKDGVAKDMNMAFKYAEKSCEAGHMYACANLSQMYKRGEGVNKNLEMAEKYKKKAKELFREVHEGERQIKFGE